MATNINGNSGPITLTDPAQDPVTVGPNGVVDGGPGIAIDGTAVDAWDISNLGAIGANISIRLQAGGSVTNGSNADTTALINGAVTGIQIESDPGKVANFGTIEATSGIGSLAVLMNDGGTIVNNTGALLRGGKEAVLISGAAGKIKNSGEIDGIILNAGGTVANEATGVIRGDVPISISAATGVVKNFGTIGGDHGVSLLTGGKVINAGTITAAGDAIFLGAGGSVFNWKSGLINTDSTSVHITGGSGTVINNGVIGEADPNGGTAIVLEAGGKIINGSANDTAASILSGNHDAITVTGDPGTIDNFGTIGSFGFLAVNLLAGGTIINHAGATIGGFHFAAVISGGTGRVENFGAIGGLSLSDGGSVNNHPGAVLRGEHGGLTIFTAPGNVKNAGEIDGMELGAGGRVTNSGTISPSFPGVGVLLDEGGTIRNDSSGIIDGIRLINGGTVINHGAIDGSGLLAGIELTASATSAAKIKDFGTVTGPIGIDADNSAPNVIVIAGTLTGTGGTAIELGTADALVIRPGAVLNGGITNFQQNDTIDLRKVDSQTVFFANGELTYAGQQVALSSPTPNLITIGSDNHGGTLVSLGSASAHTTTLTLQVSGDSWDGPPEFTVFVDGKQVGGTLSTNASHSLGQSDAVTLMGDFGPNGPHQVAVNFINDAFGGTSGTDRNLYVSSLSVDGHVFSGANAENTASLGFTDPNAALMLIDGTATFSVSTGRAVPAPTINALNSPTFHADPTLTGTAEANDTVTIHDGTTQLGAVPANGSGAWSFTPASDLAGGLHSFTATATDAGGNTSLASAAVKERITTLALQVSGDSWNGPPEFTLVVDGQQIGGTFSTSASHSLGQSDMVTLAGDFGLNGPQQVAVNFINDAFGGTSGTDRNLYVASLSVDGNVFSGASAANTASLGFTDPNAAAMLINGTVKFLT